jgi:glycosyltransferase involved in cell wall biosynthesis
MLRDHARKLKLDKNLLRFVGERDDVPDLMAAADVLVSCSEDEPFGRVLVEAGASELPVVSTRSGAKAEIIKHSKTGLLVDPGNIEALAKACAKLLGDPALRQEMGAAARERVERCYNVKRTATQLTELFELIADRKQA